MRRAFRLPFAEETPGDVLFFQPPTGGTAGNG